MNYKGLAHETVWVDGGEIESTCMAYGIPPLDRRADGSPRYTLPAIIDETRAGEPVKLVDSKPIIEYLEAAYPNADPTKALFPRGTEALQELAYHHTIQRLQGHILAVSLKGFYEKQTEGFHQHFRHLFVEYLKDQAAYEVARERAWVKVRMELETLGKVVEKNGADETNTYFLGSSISFIDLHLTAQLLSMKLSIGDEEFNRRLGDCSGGRWLRHVDMFSNYM